MNCDNCDKVCVGLAYVYGESKFCGKSCLVKSLLEYKVVKMELVM